VSAENWGKRLECSEEVGFNRFIREYGEHRIDAQNVDHIDRKQSAENREFNNQLVCFVGLDAEGI
jgi:hypothetical protein